MKIWKESGNIINIKLKIVLKINVYYRSFNWFNFGVNYTQSPYIPAAVYDGETQQTEIVRTMYFSEGATEIYDGCMY